MTTIAEIRELLELDRFAAWLNSKRDDELVGDACEPCRCPIAQYLSEQCPEHFFEVGDNEAQLTVDEEVDIALPGWAHLFIADIDWSHAAGEQVFAYDAKRVLEAARKDTER